jgi:hypothetical protein
VPRRVTVRSHWLTAALLGALAFITTARSQPFDLDWFSIAAGGATSSGGPFTLTGSIGQSATDTLGGGPYTLTGGFWSVAVAIQMPGAPLLTIHRLEASVVLSWTAPAGAFRLEETTQLGEPASWKANPASPLVSGGDHTVTLPALLGERFFRLKQAQ